MQTPFSWSDYDEFPFDRDRLLQSRLDIDGSRRVNSLPWRGQFSPELAELLIDEFIDSGTVVDPFCGSGTTLIEAARLGRSSIGSEINPAAYLLSRVYELVTLSPRERLVLISELEHEALRLESIGATFQDVAGWAKGAELLPGKYLRDAVFLLAAGNDSVVKPGRLKKATDQVSQLVMSFPDCDSTISVSLGDARQLAVADHSVEGALTSPPYINVFNYHQNYRNAVEALGWGVLSSARAEFGSNRKHRQNRFLTVIQYAQDIADALRESVRVLKPGGVAVWVVGRESRVRGVAMPNPLIVFEVATRGCGLTLLSKHERSFTSRYGQRVFEDILVFRHPERTVEGPANHLADVGREVGTSVLSSVLKKAGDAASEVEAAIENAGSVFPSIAPEFASPDSDRYRSLQLGWFRGSRAWPARSDSQNVSAC